MPHPRLSFVGLIAAAGLRFACGTAFAQDACAGVPALAKSLQATTIVSAKMTPASEQQRLPAFCEVHATISRVPGSRVYSNAILRVQASHKRPESNLLSEHVPLIHQHVLAACDAKDGLADGILTDPRSCTWDPAELACKGTPSADCLTPAQVETVRRGAGPDRFDALTAMERWVEQEKPPASMIATKANSPLSRPLCPYPQVSRYKGAIRTTPRTSRA